MQKNRRRRRRCNCGCFARVYHYLCCKDVKSKATYGGDGNSDELEFQTYQSRDVITDETNDNSLNDGYCAKVKATLTSWGTALKNRFTKSQETSKGLLGNQGSINADEAEENKIVVRSDDDLGSDDEEIPQDKNQDIIEKEIVVTEANVLPTQNPKNPTTSNPHAPANVNSLQLVYKSLQNLCYKTTSSFPYNVIPWDFTYIIAAAVIENYLYGALMGEEPLLTEYDLYGSYTGGGTLSRNRTISANPSQSDTYLQYCEQFCKVVQIFGGRIRQYLHGTERSLEVLGSMFGIYFGVKVFKRGFGYLISHRHKKNSWRRLKKIDLVGLGFDEGQIRQLIRLHYIFQNKFNGRLVLESSDAQKFLSTLWDLGKALICFSPILLNRFIYHWSTKISPNDICVQPTSVYGRNMMSFQNETEGTRTQPHLTVFFNYGNNQALPLGGQKGSVPYHFIIEFIALCAARAYASGSIGWLTVIIPFVVMIGCSITDLVKRNYFFTQVTKGLNILGKATSADTPIEESFTALRAYFYESNNFATRSKFICNVHGNLVNLLEEELLEIEVVEENEGEDENDQTQNIFNRNLFSKALSTLISYREALNGYLDQIPGLMFSAKERANVCKSMRSLIIMLDYFIVNTAENAVRGYCDYLISRHKDGWKTELDRILRKGETNREMRKLFNKVKLEKIREMQEILRGYSMEGVTGDARVRLEESIKPGRWSQWAKELRKQITELFNNSGVFDTDEEIGVLQNFNNQKLFRLHRNCENFFRGVSRNEISENENVDEEDSSIRESSGLKLVDEKVCREFKRIFQQKLDPNKNITEGNVGLLWDGVVSLEDDDLFFIPMDGLISYNETEICSGMDKKNTPIV